MKINNNNHKVDYAVFRSFAAMFVYITENYDDDDIVLLHCILK